jgi:hypothetical protein
VPDAETSVATARRLAARAGPARVLWRFDPIVLSDCTDADETVRRFARLARTIEGATTRCTISFMQRYAKVRRNLAPVEAAHGSGSGPAIDEKRAIAARLAAVAARHGIALLSCCDDALIQAGDGCEVGKGRCVDAALIDDLFPDRAGASKPGPTREACGCALSRDIGAYDTCPQGCCYCYANANPDLARRRHAAQDPRAPALGEARGRLRAPTLGDVTGADRTTPAATRRRPPPAADPRHSRTIFQGALTRRLDPPRAALAAAWPGVPRPYNR